MWVWHVGTSRSSDNVGVAHGREIKNALVYSSTWHYPRWSGGCGVWVWHVEGKPISCAKNVGSY